MEAVHRAKLLLLLADFSGVKSSMPAILARYKVKALPASCLHNVHKGKSSSCCQPGS